MRLWASNYFIVIELFYSNGNFFFGILFWVLFGVISFDVKELVMVGFYQSPEHVYNYLLNLRCERNKG